MGKYDDIIDIPYVKSSKYPHMKIEDRASMFAPFAALTGHTDAVLETERITNRKIIIDEDKKTYLDNQINIALLNNLSIVLTYFIKDKYKEGGKYVTISSNIKKIDTYKRIIKLSNNTEINLDDIVDIKIEKH